MFKDYIGLDPGKSGAIAFMCCEVEGSAIKILTLKVEDMPLANNDVDEQGISDRLEGAILARAVLEKVGARPDQGVVSMFNFGVSYGVLRGVLAARGIARTTVLPTQWKRAVGIPTGADKAGSCKRAAEIMPQFAKLFYGPRGGPLDGRADAALLAYYGALIDAGRVRGA